MQPSKSKPRIVYAANREIGLKSLRLLMRNGLVPVALMVPDEPGNLAAQQMKRQLREATVIVGSELHTEEACRRLKHVSPDYILSVHFPLIIPSTMLEIPSIGTLNLHPALLPFNRGWHTPTWAISDETPYGATLHWVDAGIDTGPIAMQREIDVAIDETAHTLYQRVLQAEYELLRDALPYLASFQLPRIPQSGIATQHRKQDIQSLQELDLSANVPVGQLIRRLRALTTSRWDEAAWFDHEGVRYRVRLELQRADQQAVDKQAQPGTVPRKAA